MKTKRIVLAIGMASMLAIASIGAIHADEAPKYELTVTITPTPALMEKVGNASLKPIVITPKEEPAHRQFKSEEECVMHFAYTDLPAIFQLMAPMEYKTDYSIDYRCEVAKTGV